MGLDPLLRLRIWSHLREIAKSGGVTIIITTHYIEEARQADTVGLMRHGRYLPLPLLTPTDDSFIRSSIHSSNESFIQSVYYITIIIIIIIIWL